jgi:uncharacterized protein (TIGR02246 family)
MKTLFVLLTGIISLNCSGQSKNELEEIKKVVLLFQDDFNEGDFKNALSYTTADWEHINPLGGIDKGQDAVLKSVRSVHQTFLKGVTMKVESMNIRFITTDVAIADVIHSITVFSTPDGVKHENEKHIKTYIVVKQNGKWLLTHDHNTIIQ